MWLDRSSRRWPTDPMQQAALPSLAYTTPLEALAEQFHAQPRCCGA